MIDHAGGEPFERSFRYHAVCVLLLIWLLVFLYPFLSTTDVLVKIKGASDATAQGSLYNQMVVVLFAVLGMVHLPGTSRLLRVRQIRALLLLVTLYLAWCGLSIFWSLDPLQSVRRFVSLVLILVGSFGLGAGFYGRTENGIKVMARHMIYVSALCVILLLFRLAGNLENIMDPQWTLKYTAQIETYAFPLGFGVAAVVYVYRDLPLRKVLIGALYFMVLLVLKGRTIILDVLSAGGIVYSRLTQVRALRILLMGVSCAIGAVLLDLVTGGQVLIQFVINESDAIAPLLPYISIGDGLRNLTQLSGRLPLWQALLPRAAESLWIGHGFGAFWTPDRFAEIYSAVRWYAVVAHNGFLEEILATGIIGLVLFLAFWIYGMYLAWRLGFSGYVVFAWLLLFLYYNTMASIIESYYQFPTFIAFTALGLVAAEYSVHRCEDCGARLIEEDMPSGELILCHP